MAQKCMEEKLKTFDQEILGIRAKLHKLPSIEENLMSLAKSMRLGLQAKKQQQSLLKYIEGNVKEKSTMIGGVTESASKGPMMESTIEGESTSMKEIEIKGKTSKGESEEN
uniref:Uncharacterized protein n=1 Tax=Cucumis melo TaxID=3656 RepID=A0A9I9CGH5_CUCME